jgi:aspartate/methionine/tyrosine aminotransferase
MFGVKQMIDMAWGSPSFLAPYWASNPINVDKVKKPIKYEIGSRRILKRRIKQLHKKVGNVDVRNKHIVVGAGASQIILALLHVLKESAVGFDSAYAHPPHFSRFPAFAKYATLDWRFADKSILITSNPNNPDNTTTDILDAVIVDACYNWPQYTSEVKKYNHPIVVFSLSKATGHASTRIGWVILRDKELAKKLEQHIEVTTGGLSIDAQVKAEKIIEHQLQSSHTVFDYGKHILEERWKLLKKLNRENKTSFSLENTSGMFLWAKGKCPEDVLHMKGSNFKSTDDYFRLNIGCSQKNFNKFIELLINGYAHELMVRPERRPH